MSKGSISEIADAIREGDANKFVEKSFKHFPFQTVALPTVATAVFYTRYFVPWRHHRWPYTPSQLELRAKVGIKTSPPFIPPEKLLMVAAAALILDVTRKMILDPPKVQ